MGHIYMPPQNESVISYQIFSWHFGASRASRV